MPVPISRFYEFGAFRLDTVERRLLREGQPVQLTAKVFDILLLLVRHRGRIVEKEELMREVWPNSFVEENNLTVNMAALRKALGNAHQGQQFIETVPKRGYRFVVSVREVADENEPTQASDDSQAVAEEKGPGRQETLERAYDEHGAQAPEDAGGWVRNGQTRTPRSPLSTTPHGSSGPTTRASANALALALSVLFIVFITGTGYVLYKRFSHAREPQSFQKMKLTRLTTNGKVFGDAAISRDGKYVVYVMSSAGQHSIWLKHVATGSEVPIVPPAESFYTGPVFSTDGNYVYYLDCGPAVTCALYKVAVLGGPASKVLDNVNSPVAFSPDGKQMTFVRDNASTLVVANADGNEARSLVTLASPVSFSDKAPPGWSPDGKIIACPISTLGDSGNYMSLTGVSLADGTQQPITSQRWRYIGQASWLPDGSGLLINGREMASSTDAPTQLWRISYPNGATEKVTNDLAGHNGVSLTADGSALVTVQTSALSNIWIVPGDGDASRAVQLTSGTGARRDGYDGLSWTPDGRIVYASDDGGNLNLWVMKADGSGQKKLTDDAFGNIAPTVSPDGRYIVFESNRAGAHCLWRMDIDGGNLRQLTYGPLDLWHQVSADGKWVVYTAGGPERPSLWRVSIEGGTPVRITEPPSYVPAISPDGKMLAYLQDQQTPGILRLTVIPFAGGEPIKTFDAPTMPGNVQRFQWLPDSSALAYAATTRGRVMNLWSRPLDGSESKQLTTFKSDSIFWFEWSRDGKQLALARGTAPRDVLLISDFK